MASKTIEVIMPVRNMAEHLPFALGPLFPQLAEGDVVTVIDDASTDDSAAVARALGANVLTLPDSQGPYYARQVAASRSSADILLFLDARSRPLPEFIDAHRRLQSQPTVALSSTNVRTQSGPTLAARISASEQTHRLPKAGPIPGKPSYAATANLGIDKAAFDKVGGFRRMRSSGDADICWRVQEQSLGTFAADYRVLMEWQPRATMRELASQWRRFGRGAAYLQWAYQVDQQRTGEPVARRRAVRNWLANAWADARKPPLRQLSHTVVMYWWQQGFRAERRKSAEFQMPTTYDLGASPQQIRASRHRGGLSGLAVAADGQRSEYGSQHQYPSGGDE
jgi:glycosyltransferase involved in cell wall biosynthesis